MSCSRWCVKCGRDVVVDMERPAVHCDRCKRHDFRDGVVVFLLAILSAAAYIAVVIWSTR